MVKVRGGYKVQKTGGKPISAGRRYFSNSPLSKERAEAQMRALYVTERQSSPSRKAKSSSRKRVSSPRRSAKLPTRRQKPLSPRVKKRMTSPRPKKRQSSPKRKRN